MSTTVLVSLTLSDADSDAVELGDVSEAVAARLSEFYPDSLGGFCVPASLRVVATTGGVVRHLLDAAAVGLSHDATGDLDVAAALAATSLSVHGSTVAVVDPSRL